MAIIPENLRHKKAALAVTEILLGLLVLIMLVSYRGSASLRDMHGDSHGQHYRLVFRYPFVSGTGSFYNSSGTGGLDQAVVVPFDTTVKPTAELFLGTSCLAIAVAVIRLVLYVALGEHPRSQMIPPGEIMAASFMTVIIFISGSLLPWQVANTLAKDVADNILQLNSDCSDFSGRCSVTSASYSTVYAAAAFMIFSGFVWTANIWLAFRNTYLHQPYYVSQMEAGDGPGAREIPNSTTAASAYGTAGEGSRGRQFRPQQWEPKEMTVISPSGAADRDHES